MLKRRASAAYSRRARNSVRTPTVSSTIDPAVIARALTVISSHA